MAGRHPHLRGFVAVIRDTSGLGLGMLDSQHSTVAFSSGVELLTKKAGGEDLAVSTNDPLHRLCGRTNWWS